MISTLKNFLRPLKNFIRISDVLEWYLVSLAVESTKHTLEHASKLSGFSASQFSRFLTGASGTSEIILANLSKKAVKILSKTESHLNEILAKLPWKVYVIIDSTPQKRSASKWSVL